jgi:isoquinoline 1-oxidoreductase beta subunit
MGTTRRVVLGVLGGTTALVVGYALWPSHRMERLNALDAKAGQKFFGNWIKIGTDDSVTVVIPHCDMGTGIFTGLKQMAAEELYLDFDKVTAEQAPPDALFANGALAEAFLMGPAAAKVPTFLRGTVDNTFRFLAANLNTATQAPDFQGYGGLQVTGGSSAIRGTGMFGTRVAAAAAREMLVKAAAARWKIDPSSCTTKDGKVFGFNGQSFRYGELVEDASKLEPSHAPALKPRSEYALVGKPVPRIDIPAKVNGTTNYGIDVKQPGMLYAAIKISPVFGGKLLSVDTHPIEGRRGIKNVIRLGDAVVVVADRFWRARDAVAALDPIWDNAGNGKITSDIIIKRQEAALKSSDLKSDVKTGSGADALAGGKLIEATYRVPYLSHAPMEPMNITALFKDGKLEVWSGTQDGLGSRGFCAKTAGLPMDAVSFHLMPSGGAFGRRLPGQWNFLTYGVKTAMAMPGVPIKLLFTREQDMQHDFYRPSVMSRFRATLDKNGAPIAWVNDYSGTGDKKADSEAHIPYDIPNQAISWKNADSHVPTGPWRSVEASWHGFFVESFVDELAIAAGKDPLEYRRSLLQNAPRHLATLNLAAEKAGWGKPLPRGWGRGIAIVESFDSIVAHVAEVEVKDGVPKVHRIVSAVDCGFAVNPDGVKAQIESGILYGLTAALFDEITIDQGAVVQQSFPDYEMVRLADCPEIEVYIHEDDGPVGGAGEPGVPPTAPAVANAIFAATGVRVRDLPFKNHTLTASAGKTKAA